MARRFSPSFKMALTIGVAACIGLSGCNKLGYTEIRTAPEGQAMLGPKRYPQFNNSELQKQQAAMAMQAQQRGMPQGAPAMPMMPQQSQPQYAPQQQQQMPLPPQVPANYPVTPYSSGSQSYQMQQQPQQPQQQAAEAQQSSYVLPYEFAPGSYYQSGVATPQQNGGLAQTVSVTDYYSQDIQQSPVAAIAASTQQYQQQMQQQQIQPQQWYAPAAPVGDVYGRPLPVSAPSSYNAGYATDAAYGRYREPSLGAMPADPTSYQPMTARQAAAYPSRDPYAEELSEPAYNNVFYGGTGMPQGQSRDFSPNFEAAAAGQPMTNGFGQRASGMINPVSSSYYADAPQRRPLEEPPMLIRDSELPRPGDNYYDAGSYQ